MYPIKARAFIAPLCLLISAQSFALPEDKTQVMQLLADAADLDQNTHQGKYIGHVEFTQGSTNLRAARAITRGGTGNQLELAIAYGDKQDQAHFWTKTDKEKPPLHAYADEIRYYPQKHLIQLLGHAHIAQGQNSFSAPHIDYDSQKQQIISKKKGTERTLIVLYPEKKTS